VANDRWGIGEYVPDAFRDKWTLYAIAQHCDVSVPNGFGGWEPRWSFNFAIASAQDALRLLMALGICLSRNGLLGLRRRNRDR
jgi:predicted phage tail protein